MTTQSTIFPTKSYLNFKDHMAGRARRFKNLYFEKRTTKCDHKVWLVVKKYTNFEQNTYIKMKIKQQWQKTVTTVKVLSCRKSILQSQFLGQRRQNSQSNKTQKDWIQDRSQMLLKLNSTKAPILNSTKVPKTSGIFWVFWNFQKYLFLQSLKVH